MRAASPVLAPFEFPPDEEPTQPGVEPSAIPAATRTRSDAPSAYAARRPRESTTYSLVPKDAEGVSLERTRIPRLAPPPRDLTAGASLGPAQRDRIDRLYRNVTSMTHYQLLGVPRDADRDALRAARRRLLNAFDPERYARATLGVYRRKIEILFACVQDAYDTLGTPQRRAAYDAELRAAEVDTEVTAEVDGVDEPPTSGEAPTLAFSSFRR